MDITKNVAFNTVLIQEKCDFKNIVLIQMNAWRLNDYKLSSICYVILFSNDTVISSLIATDNVKN